MSIADTTRILQLILAPVVVLSACGILASGILAHYQSINDRLRALARERLDLVLGSTQPDRIGRERLTEIDGQLTSLLARHGQVRDALLLLYVAIALFIACMIATGIAAWNDTLPISSAVLLFFLAGIVLLLAAIVRIAAEIRVSHQALSYEVMRVAALRRDHDV